MVGDDDSDVLVLQLGDDVLDVLHGDRIDSRERLVQEDELRVDREGAGYFAAAPFTSGELDSETLADLREVEFVYQVLKSLLPFPLGHLGHLHHRHNVVFDRHLAEDGSLLREVADTFLSPLVHRKLGDVLVVQEYPSAVRNDLPRDHIEAGGLAGSVRTEEAYDLSLVDFHRDALHDRPDAVFLDKLFAAQFHILSILFPNRSL